MKPIAIDEFCRLTFLSDVAFSPDGKAACYVVSNAVKEENKYQSFLCLRKDGVNRRLTTFGKETSFCWESSDSVLFPGNREEKQAPTTQSKYYRISISGGEAELAYTFPIPVQKLIPMKNGDLLLVGTVFPGYEELYTGSPKLRESYLKDRKDNEDYEIVQQVPWWWNGGTYTRGAYSGLYYYHSRSKRLTWLSKKGFSVSDVKLSKDETTVYYSLLDVSVPQPNHFGGENLYRMDLKTRQESCICPSREGFALLSYELGDSFILLIASDGKYGINTDPDFYTLDYASLEVKPYAAYGFSLSNSVCTDVRMGEECSNKMVGDTYYFLSTRFDSVGLYKLEQGQITPVIEKDGSIDCFDIFGDEMLMVALWDLRAQELYDGKCRKVSSFNDTALRGKFLSRPEPLYFTNGDHEVHGFVMKPYGFEPGKKYPVILDIHGGPKCVYSTVLFHETQYWAGQGYFVIYCNPTGSDGRGEYMNILGKYGTVDFEDIMAFCDAALEAWPEMDADNFFETGGSYGGFMTNWIIGHTDRFRACASQRSISNWTSFYGVSDIGIGFSEDQNATTMWPSVEKMWWHSPLKYADRCKTPTLFLHSFEDYRCPVDQGYQMYSALVAHGVESRLVLFRGENHELSRTGKPKHRIKRLEEITSWFESHKR